jgi:hypothetical protein
VHPCARTSLSPVSTLTPARWVRRHALVALAILALVAHPAAAAPGLGFIEEFAGTSTGSWSGGTNFTNPGTGGFLGGADGYLLLDQGFPSQFGSSGRGAEYVGDWTAAGITQIQVWMNDVGADDPLEMHLQIGRGDQSVNANFWMYTVGFLPPHNAWGLYTVDLTSDAQWFQHQGTGTFAAALTDVDRILIRHDPAPYLPHPNLPEAIAADVGIDHVLLTAGTVGVAPPAPAAVRPVELAPPYPNPSSGPVTVAVRAAGAGPIQVQIVDVAGRSVRTARIANPGGGPHTWLWDGMDDAGRRTPAGHYRVRAFGDAGGMSRPITRIR